MQLKGCFVKIKEALAMKRITLVLIAMLAMAGFATAQITSPTADVLGAHNVYGRGCVACHAPHSGAAANGKANSANSGNLALWGELALPFAAAQIGRAHV